MTSYCSICKSEVVVGFVKNEAKYIDESDIYEYRCSKHLRKG